VDGAAVAGSFDVATGDTVFAQSDRVEIRAGTTGMVGLVAYTGIGPIPDLLRCVVQPNPTAARRPQEGQAPSALTRSEVAPTHSHLETTK
jgi:hypothetical protein